MALEFQSPRFQGDPLLLQILNDPDTGQPSFVMVPGTAY